MSIPEQPLPAAASRLTGLCPGRDNQTNDMTASQWLAGCLLPMETTHLLYSRAVGGCTLALESRQQTGKEPNGNFESTNSGRSNQAREINKQMLWEMMRSREVARHSINQGGNTKTWGSLLLPTRPSVCWP
jgi:hypothetical protein